MIFLKFLQTFFVEKIKNNKLENFAHFLWISPKFSNLLFLIFSTKLQNFRYIIKKLLPNISPFFFLQKFLKGQLSYSAKRGFLFYMSNFLAFCEYPQKWSKSHCESSESLKNVFFLKNCKLLNVLVVSKKIFFSQIKNNSESFPECYVVFSTLEIFQILI